MKRSKKSETGAKPAAAAVSARVVVHEVPAKPEEVLKRYNAFALADALHDQAIKSGEPVSPNFAKHVTEQHGAAGKLLEAVPVIRSAKKRAAILKESHVQAAEKKKKAVLDIAERLRLEDRRRGVPGRTKHLAGLVYKKLPQPESAKDDKRPSVRTIRRWISEARKK
jgi:hypothetical protein